MQKQVKYKCDYCDFVTENEKECKEHESEKHHSRLLDHVKALKNYCETNMNLKKGCSTCRLQTSDGERCLLDFFPHNWNLDIIEGHLTRKD